ncbi:hypothetical protein CANCADRAFT_57356 [Tortispora caseinolytica NRRL Y-17796]|uniref:HTH La-type RNA-binding domain-containing protein n=1 Tax=Tortispora caseinolytica NRRL Y-17796 TaxID=767744 RepID=A0A1E4TGZ6_9ASCO|nr:hypothetical protein CANCADRAFT_57356 [Tortispora caseinolytica NRRL Y-17796]
MSNTDTHSPTASASKTDQSLTDLSKDLASISLTKTHPSSSTSLAPAPPPAVNAWKVQTPASVAEISDESVLALASTPLESNEQPSSELSQNVKPKRSAGKNKWVKLPQDFIEPSASLSSAPVSGASPGAPSSANSAANVNGITSQPDSSKPEKRNSGQKKTNRNRQNHNNTVPSNGYKNNQSLNMQYYRSDDAKSSSANKQSSSSIDAKHHRSGNNGNNFKFNRTAGLNSDHSSSDLNDSPSNGNTSGASSSNWHRDYQNNDKARHKSFPSNSYSQEFQGGNRRQRASAPFIAGPSMPGSSPHMPPPMFLQPGSMGFMPPPYTAVPFRAPNGLMYPMPMPMMPPNMPSSALEIGQTAPRNPDASSASPNNQASQTSVPSEDLPARAEPQIADQMPSGYPQVPGSFPMVVPPEFMYMPQMVPPMPQGLMPPAPLIPIIGQLRYYFSVDNLIKDIYLRGNMNSHGLIPLSVILAFQRIKKFTGNDMAMLKDAVKYVPEIELFGDHIRLRFDWEKWIMPMESRTDAGKDDSVVAKPSIARNITPETIYIIDQTTGGDKESTEQFYEPSVPNSPVPRLATCDQPVGWTIYDEAPENAEGLSYAQYSKRLADSEVDKGALIRFWRYFLEFNWNEDIFSDFETYLQQNEDIYARESLYRLAIALQAKNGFIPPRIWENALQYASFDRQANRFYGIHKFGFPA